MSYTAKDLFSDWYSTVELQPSSEILAARTKAIKKVISKEKKNESFWLDIVNLFLGLTVKVTANRESFVQEFKNADENFQLTNNDNLVRVLASATLCFKLETDDERLNNIISSAIINSTFFGQYDLPTKIPVVDYANTFLSGDRYMDRKTLISKAEEVANSFGKAPAPAAGEESKGDEERDKLVNGVLLPIISSYRSLSEESNILWWIFREYSDINEKYFKELEYQELITTGAYELSNLTEFSRGLTSAEAILHRVLSIANEGKSDFKKTSVYDTVNQLGEGVKKKITLPNEITELTPCLKAIKISLDHNPEDNWTGAFSKQTNGADSKKKFLPTEIALQFYREFMFIKSL